MATDISGISKYWYTLTGVLLVLTVITQPDGMAVKNVQISAAITRRFKDARGRPQSVIAGQ